MKKDRYGACSPALALVIASALAEVFFTAGFQGQAETPLREKIWGLALAQLAMVCLLAAGSRAVKKQTVLFRILAGAAASLALMRTMKETWRAYSLYMGEGGSMVLFGALAALVAAWGIYWGWPAAFCMAKAALAAAAGVSILVVASLVHHAEVTALAADPLQKEAVVLSFGSMLFFLPEAVFLMTHHAGRKGRTGAYALCGAVLWAVQGFWWVLADMVWPGEGTTGVFETARLGLLSVFRRFDVLYMPVLLLLYFARLVLYTLWLSQLWAKGEKSRGPMGISWGLCMLGAVFLYSGEREILLHRGEQILLWGAWLLYTAGRKEKMPDGSSSA